MLHKRRVLTTLYYRLRREVRVLLHIKPRVRPPPVLSQPLESVVERHGWIARSLLEHMPKGYDFTGKDICEIGSGDCLAAAALFLGKGVRHVDMIEVEPPYINEKQRQVLQELSKQGLPVDLSIINGQEPLALDKTRVAYHRCYMESFNSNHAHDFLFSFSVVEHVEDLPAFYASCRKTLKPGGWMLHIIDLGGHHLFEDPMPPLDFQTHPDWLFSMMYAPYGRATRRPLAEHVQSAKAAGFTVEPVQIRREVDSQYLEKIWPQLRAGMRHHPKNEAAVIEFALLARKTD
jgi:hypothetical protein